MAEEAIEVTAEIIEPVKKLSVVYTPAKITWNLDDLSKFVDRQIYFYEGVTIDPENEKQVKDARNICAEINAIKKPIETERKRIKKEYEAPLKAFEEQVKTITKKIDDAYRSIKNQIDEADAMFKENRRAHLEEEYVGVAGILVDVIPFSAILDPKWLTRSRNLGMAEKELQEKAVSALKGYETLLTKNLSHKDEVVKKYVESLDILAALQLEDELLEKDRQMAEFKANQEALKQVEPDPVVEAETPSKDATSKKADSDETTANTAPVCLWTLNMEFRGTKQFAQEVASTLNGMGISGATIKNMGVISDE